MTQPEIPPCPDELLRKLRKPSSHAKTAECLPVPGTVWEVRAPDGEFLVFMIVQQFDANEANPFAFFRAIPISDYVRLTENDDAIVTIESSATILAAHCWLEGPVLASSLVRCIGSVSSASMEVVAKARAQSCPPPVNSAVAAFRKSLYEQFDPVFTACWQELYTSLGEENSESESSDELGVGPIVSDAPTRSRVFDLPLPEGHYALAAAPGGLLGDITKVVVMAATGAGRDPLTVLHELGIDEPCLQTNPVWCLDQLAAAVPSPEIKRRLYDVLEKHNIYLPPVVVDEIKRDREQSE